MKPKLAVVDLLLHYPPKGGACVDVFSVFGILGSDFDIRLFCPRWPSVALARGSFSEPQPLPVEVVEVARASKEEIIGSLLSAVAAWAPDIVFIADGWTLKPYLINAFRGRWPVVVRFYAYEGLCPRNNERWLPEGACPNHALTDPAKCMVCAKGYYDIVREKRGGSDNPLTEEMRIAGIFQGDYARTLKEALTGLRSIVYNKSIAGILQGQGGAIAHVVPGGVDTELFTPGPGRKSKADGDFEILVAGRMGDPAKGASTAIEAGNLLDSYGFKLRMNVSRPETAESAQRPWLCECGWKRHAELIEMMRSSDCAIVPSRWEEAFGMVWAEAMAVGLPVIASAVAGPLEYIIDGENGLLFPPGDAKALASCIAWLAGDQALRVRLIEGGLRTVRERLRWDFAAKATKDTILAALRASS